MTAQKVSGDNLLALLATADVVSIDGQKYARSLRRKAACEPDEVTTDGTLFDLIAVTPRLAAEGRAMNTGLHGSPETFDNRR
ncbi:hypothetical protein ACT2FY_36085 [Paraburkholderia fungorum]|uniref:hypothetical protein n=1 Tax=Paraburkholderia fungorum TaxID=134537 RepID=UPI00402BA2EC